MYEVISNDILAPNLHRLVVRAPRIAPSRRAGQFVIVRAEQGGERIPLTIGDADPAAGTITLFVQAIGASTRKIVAIPAGGAILDVAGPLGQPTHIGQWERVACVGGGVGTAVLYPVGKHRGGRERRHQRTGCIRRRRHRPGRGYGDLRHGGRQAGRGRDSRLHGEWRRLIGFHVNGPGRTPRNPAKEFL